MKIPVNECPSGPGIDAVVALARGWTVGEYDPDRGFTQPVWVDQDGINRYSVQRAGRNARHYWCPSVYIEQAWELAEELERVSLYMPDAAIGQEHRAGGEYTAEHLPSPDMDPWDSIVADGDSANLALMRVYLKAKHVEFILVPDDDEFSAEDIRLVKRGELSEFFSAIGSKCIPQDGKLHLLVVRWDRATGLRDVRVDDKKVDVQFDSPEEQGTMWDWIINPMEERVDYGTASILDDVEGFEHSDTSPHVDISDLYLKSPSEQGIERESPIEPGWHRLDIDISSEEDDPPSLGWETLIMWDWDIDPEEEGNEALD